LARSIWSLRKSSVVARFRSNVIAKYPRRAQKETRLPWLKYTLDKLFHYAGELNFAARAPTSLEQSLRLIRYTFSFHYRNWRKEPVDPAPRLSLGLNFSGYSMSLSLRPFDGDISIFYEVFARNSYKISDVLLPPENVRAIVDVGANIGFASLYLASRYPRAFIYSVEPNPDNYALLQANTANEPRIVPIPACITPLPHQQMFIETTGKAFHFRTNAVGLGAPVRGMSLDELCEEHSIGKIDLLKIDAEGAEREIFADGAFLPRVGVIVAELHGDYGLAQFQADICPWGFAARMSEYTPEPNIVVASASVLAQP
jgi:FkbM family methyltransferase